MNLITLACGYLLGGIPTADWLASRRGIDLRASGSGNPGANNAMRLGGRQLALAILVTEMTKGFATVMAGHAIDGGRGMVMAGAGAVAGNVLNPYRRLRGGQGLAITAGVLLTSVPIAAAAGIVVIALVARATHASAPAALVALGSVVVTAAWLPFVPWGLDDRRLAVALALAVVLVVGPKQIQKLRSVSRPPTPAPG